MSKVHNLTARDLVVARQEPARKRQRKPTLASVAKQAAKAGIEVARYEVDADGKISIVTGNANEPNTETGNEWDSVLQ
jgi:hypothetical protein